MSVWARRRRGRSEEGQGHSANGAIPPQPAGAEMAPEFEYVHNAVGMNLDVEQTLPFPALTLQKCGRKSNAGLKDWADASK